LSELGSIFPSGYLFSCIAVAIVHVCVCAYLFACLSVSAYPAALEPNSEK
jgi:hypothetical protein